MPVQYAIEVVNFTTTDRALNCSSGAIQKRHEAAWSCPSNYNETIPTKRERQFDSKKKPDKIEINLMLAIKKKTRKFQHWIYFPRERILQTFFVDH